MHFSLSRDNTVLFIASEAEAIALLETIETLAAQAPKPLLHGECAQVLAALTDTVGKQRNFVNKKKRLEALRREVQALEKELETRS